jgi:glycosyltransferase involved in cell wall biosynthesis
MIKAPKVSVIVPNYNHSLYLEQRLESIYNQTFQDFEVILLDDCSPDNSREILSSYAKHPKTSHCVFNKENSGSPFKQWAKGISLAQGEFIWIAESDDKAETEFLEKLYPLIHQNKNVGIVFCNSLIIDENNEIKYTLSDKPDVITAKSWKLYDGISFITKYMLSGNGIPNASACLIRKEAIVSTDLYNNSLKLSGDFLTWLLILANYSLVFIDKPLNYFRFHTNNVRSRNADNGFLWIESLETWASIKTKSVLPESIISQAVNTPLVHCIEIFFKRKNQKINIKFLSTYIRVFHKNPFKLMYGYIFKFKRVRKL